MIFGLSNTPSTFMILVYHILKPFIEKSVIICFNDIFIYSKSEEHLLYLREVLSSLPQEVYIFNHCNKLLFLGFLVGSNGIQVDERKIQAIISWSRPR